MINKNIFFLVLVLSFVISSCVPVVVGTTAAKAGSIVAQDRSAGNALDDTTIWTSIKKGFWEKGFHKLFTKIHVQVIEGRVLMTGEVDSSDDMRQAVEIAWSRSGVKEVLNELQIARKPSNSLDVEQYALDSWISGRVKSKMLLDKEIKSVNYSVITENNIVYLFGIARSEEELEKVASIAAKIRGVNKVVSHVHVKDLDLSPASIKNYRD